MVMEINRDSDSQVDSQQGLAVDSGKVTPATSPAASEIYRDEKKRAQFNAYLARYRFERDPFIDQDNSGLFYPGSGRQQAVQSLLHFSRYGSTPVFLTGPTGAGKTATLSAAVRELKGDVDIASIRAELMMSTAQVFTALATGLGIDIYHDSADDVEWLGQNLLAFFESNTAIDRQSLICIDNVEDLGHEALASIFTLLAAAEGKLAAILVGQQQVLSLLESAAETEDLLINRIELTPFSQSEVYDYVFYRLEAVGFKGEFPLSQMQLQALTYRSQGSVRQLHQVVRSMLMAGKASQIPSRKPFPLSHAFALIFLTILIVFIYNSNIEEPASVKNFEPIVLVGAQSELTQEPESNFQSSIEDEPHPTVKDAFTVKTADQVRTSLQALANDLPSAKNTDVMSGSYEVVTITPSTAVEDVGVTRDIATQQIDLKKKRGNFQPENRRLTIVDWPDTGYALQIFGTHNPKRAKQLVEQYAEQLSLFVYETRYSGKPWFVVVSGPYTGRNEAKQAIQDLASGLQRLRPWPRNIASIQSDIQRFSAVIDPEEE
ncbi:MAG: hypothetical protein CL691_06370 [Cellvibrionales bacterium]|nr:hypothetical protein [Cellvibrionales bacterium]|tara:strand:- start:20010 stop:21650 length:1641 start_codon:yes stop_codon:yes gene_type:complete